MPAEEGAPNDVQRENEEPLRLVRNKGNDRPKLTARGQFGRFGSPVNDDMAESVVGEHPGELGVDLIPYLIGISPCAQLQDGRSACSEWFE